MNSTATAILVGSMGLIIVCILGWYVIQAIAYWRIFTKAGEAGWKSLIPVYNSYIQYKISWDTRMFWISIIGTAIGMYLYNMDNSFSTVGGVVALAASALNWIDLYKLSLSFGHGIGYTLGLIFLNPIFILILGFSNDQYQGPQ